MFGTHFLYSISEWYAGHFRVPIVDQSLENAQML